MKEEILKEITRLQNGNYHITGDIYLVLDKLKEFVVNLKDYDKSKKT